MANHLFLPLMFPFPTITPPFNYHVLDQPSRQSSRSNLQASGSIDLLDQTASYWCLPHTSCYQPSKCFILVLLWTTLAIKTSIPTSVPTSLSNNKTRSAGHRTIACSKTQWLSSPMVTLYIRIEIQITAPTASAWSISPAKDQESNLPHIHLGWYFRMHTKLGCPRSIYLRNRLNRRGGCWFS